MAETTFAANRAVFTYEDPWPSGCLTGYDDAGGFVIEHVIAWRPGVLPKMLAAGLKEARARGYAHVRCRLPQAFPPTPKLRRLAKRVGFAVYHEDAEWVDLAWYP